MATTGEATGQEGVRGEREKTLAMAGVFSRSPLTLRMYLREVSLTHRLGVDHEMGTYCLRTACVAGSKRCLERLHVDVHQFRGSSTDAS